MRSAVVCAVLVCACQQKQQDAAARAQPARRDLTATLGPVSRAALGDLDGDGRLELVTVGSRQVLVTDATSGRQIAAAPVTAGIQVLVVADIDGDHRAEIVAGWGMTREFRAAGARISRLSLVDGRLVEETIAEPETERDDIAAIVPMPDRKALLVAYFDAKYTVTSAIARRGAAGWQLDTIGSIRMATSYARGDLDGDGTPELVVGRAYGDALGLDGDAFVLAADGRRTPLPTTRGLRSLAIAGGDVFVGDGWHQNYATNARGLLTWIRRTPAGFRAQLIEDTQGQYAIERIVPATIDGKQALVTLGNRYVRVFVRDGDSWRGLTIGGAARDIAVGDIDGVPGDEIVIAGDTSEVVDLHGVRW